MIGDIKLKSILFEDNEVVVMYNLEVGENSKAVCSVIIADNDYKYLDSEEKLLQYINNTVG